MTTSYKNPLGYEKLPKLLKNYALPSIIALLVSSLYNIVDQIFIGQDVGYLGNAATNVSYPLITISLALALLIGVGSAARLGLSLGAGKKDDAAQTVGNAIALMAILGISYLVIIQFFLRPLLTLFGATTDVLPYAMTYTRITAFGLPLLMMTNGMSNLIRADGKPTYSMFCMVVGAVINTVLDPIFIFVFDMGIAGAALATVLSQLVSFLLAITYIRKFKHVQLTKAHFKLKKAVCLKITSLGMSNSLNQVAITFVQIVLNNSLTYYGAQSIYGSDIPLAASGIVMKTNALLLSVMIGFAQGSQPIISFNYGAKNYDRVRGTYKLAACCTLIVSTLGFLAFQFFPRQVISIFGTGDELYFEFAVKFMRIFLFMIFINGIQVISANFFSAIGKPMKGVFLSLSRQVIFLIPLILVLPLFLGIDGILFAAPIADVLAFCMALILVSKELRSMRALTPVEHHTPPQKSVEA